MPGTVSASEAKHRFGAIVDGAVPSQEESQAQNLLRHPIRSRMATS